MKLKNQKKRNKNNQSRSGGFSSSGLNSAFKILLVTVMVFLPLFLSSNAFSEEAYDCRVHYREDKCPDFIKLKVATLTKMYFGKMAASMKGETIVVINPNTGQRVIHQGFDVGGKYSPGVFELTGKPTKLFVVTLPDEIVLAGTTPGGWPHVTYFTGYLPDQPTNNRWIKREGRRLVGQFGRDGKAMLIIGGTYHMVPGQQKELYGAPFPMFVDYLFKD